MLVVDKNYPPYVWSAELELSWSFLLLFWFVPLKEKKTLNSLCIYLKIDYSLYLLYFVCCLCEERKVEFCIPELLHDVKGLFIPIRGGGFGISKIVSFASAGSRFLEFVKR